jgi:hypothetical protein
MTDAPTSIGDHHIETAVGLLDGLGSCLSIFNRCRREPDDLKFAAALGGELIQGGGLRGIASSSVDLDVGALEESRDETEANPAVGAGD